MKRKCAPICFFSLLFLSFQYMKIFCSDSQWTFRFFLLQWNRARNSTQRKNHQKPSSSEKYTNAFQLIELTVFLLIRQINWTWTNNWTYLYRMVNWIDFCAKVVISTKKRNAKMVSKEQINNIVRVFFLFLRIEWNKCAFVQVFIWIFKQKLSYAIIFRAFNNFHGYFWARESIQFSHFKLIFNSSFDLCNRNTR